MKGSEVRLDTQGQGSLCPLPLHAGDHRLPAARHGGAVTQAPARGTQVKDHSFAKSRPGRNPGELLTR